MQQLKIEVLSFPLKLSVISYLAWRKRHLVLELLLKLEGEEEEVEVVVEVAAVPEPEPGCLELVISSRVLSGVSLFPAWSAPGSGSGSGSGSDLPSVWRPHSRPPPYVA